MATYSSEAYTKNLPIAQLGHAGEVKAAFFTVTCAAAPATTDTINFGYMPANARLLSAALKSSDMDTNGAPALALNVGDSGDPDRIFAASTVGQAGTVDRSVAATGQGYLYTEKTLITGVASTNAATGAAGTLYLTVLYMFDPPRV